MQWKKICEGEETKEWQVQKTYSALMFLWLIVSELVVKSAGSNGQF